MSSAGKTKQTQTTNYQYMTAPPTAADTALDAETASSGTPDPSIAYRAANQKKSLRNSLSSISGADYSPETEAAIKYSGEHQIDQESGQAYQQDAYNQKQSKWQKLYAIAESRRPQLVSTGGTNTQSGGFWSSFGAGMATAII